MKPDRIHEVQRRLLLGQSYRQIAAALRCSHRDIQPVRDALLVAKQRFEPCGCERRAGHLGMCGFRLSTRGYYTRTQWRHLDDDS